MPITTTSVSTVLIRIFFIPRWAPSEACTNILVSASACVQSISSARSAGADDNTFLPWVIMTIHGMIHSKHVHGWDWIALACFHSHTGTLASYLVFYSSLQHAFWYMYLSSVMCQLSI
jgi:hypothetical protein